MKVFTTFLAFLLGVILGAAAFHSPTVHAQTGPVTIQKVSMRGIMPGTAPGPGRVAGLSCVPADDGNADCYVAIQD
jgi:hypothetical protein